MTKNPILDAPAVREARQEVRWAVCQNCEDGAEWGRIREALDAYALTVEGVVRDEAKRLVEAMEPVAWIDYNDGDRRASLDRAAVLRVLDGGTNG